MSEVTKENVEAALGTIFSEAELTAYLLEYGQHPEDAIRAYITQLELQVNYWKTRHKLREQRVKVLEDAARNYIDCCPADRDTTNEFLEASYLLEAALSNKEQS